MRDSSKHFIRQPLQLLLGKRLDQIMHGAHLKAFQRMVGRGRGEDQQAVRVECPQFLRRVHAAHARHIDVQKRRGETLFPFRREKRLAAFKFQQIGLHAAPLQLPLQPFPQKRPIPGKVIHNRNSHHRRAPFQSIITIIQYDYSTKIRLRRGSCAGFRAVCAAFVPTGLPKPFPSGYTDCKTGTD